MEADLAALSPELIAFAEGKAAEIRQRAGRELDRLQREVRNLGGGGHTPRHRRLMQLASEAAALVAPSTPCRKGCSDCCYQAVPISLHQAKLLSAASGRKINYAAGRPISEEYIRQAEANAEARLADPTPCPFLVDSVCSVYGERPITCRAHHVLHPDSSRCSLFDHKTIAQAKFDLSWIENAAAAEGFADLWADVRDFFPPEA